MAEESMTESPQEPQPKRLRTPLPAGYRQGFISAITVLLGFSLLFVRYWDFELPGEWSLLSEIAAALLTLAVALQIVTLWRSLQVKDDDEVEYSKTLRWFLWSIVVLMVSLAISGLSYSHDVRK